MFKDERRSQFQEVIRGKDLRAFSRFLTPALFLEAAIRTGTEIVACPLCVVNLVWLGIAAAFHPTKSFAGVLVVALKILQDQAGFEKSALGRKSKGGRSKQDRKGRSKHDPRRADPFAVTEEAYSQARHQMPFDFWGHLIELLIEACLREHREKLSFGGFRLLAMDGTTIDLPNWKKLRDHFGTSKNGTGTHAAQGRLTMLQFPRARLPYRYEFTSLAEGENTVARRLVKSLSAKDLVLMDAGFWSYGLFWDIQRQNSFFAIRLKPQVTLKPLRSQGRSERLVRWTPSDTRGKWRQEGLPKSIDLRVIDYHIRGYRKQSIVTNVLDRSAISREEWTRLTTQASAQARLLPGLQHQRWEIETGYRELKVEQGLEGGLRGRTPETIRYEVAGQIVLYLLTRWLILDTAQKYGLDPLRLSFLNAQRELHDMATSLLIAPPKHLQTLLERLLERIAMHQVHYRPGRHYPRKKRKSSKAKDTTTNKA